MKCLSFRNFFLGLIAFAGLSQTALAEDAQLSCPKPGTVIRTSTGVELYFSASDGLSCSLASNGLQITLYGLLLGTKANFFADAKEHIQQLWPLSVGNKVNFDSNWTRSGGREVHAEFEYGVDSQEKITVPAGQYQVYVVHAHEKVNSRKDSRVLYEANRTYYISTSVGFWVKYDVAVTRGYDNNPSQPWEMVSLFQK